MDGSHVSQELRRTSRTHVDRCLVEKADEDADVASKRGGALLPLSVEEPAAVLQRTPKPPTRLSGDRLATAVMSASC
jgi:hypothetical protein